jgi:hypothetical protein
LQADPHVGAVFVGPSGVGIKCAVRIDGTRHLASFNSAKEYFAKEYGLQLDKACKDIERLCFLSFDPEAWCRQGGTKVLPVTEQAEMEVVRAKLNLGRSGDLDVFAEATRLRYLAAGRVWRVQCAAAWGRVCSVERVGAGGAPWGIREKAQEQA